MFLSAALYNASGSCDYITHCMTTLKQAKIVFLDRCHTVLVRKLNYRENKTMGGDKTAGFHIRSTIIIITEYILLFKLSLTQLPQSYSTYIQRRAPKCLHKISNFNC